MKQCNNYEDALYFDCLNCDEECEYRKQPVGKFFLLYLVVIICISYIIS